MNSSPSRIARLSSCPLSSASASGLPAHAIIASACPRTPANSASSLSAAQVSPSSLPSTRSCAKLASTATVSVRRVQDATKNRGGGLPAHAPGQPG